MSAAPSPPPAAFDCQPTLEGPLVLLRPLRAEDYDALYAAAADPLVWAQHPESTRHEPDVFRRYFDGAMASGGAFVMLDRADGRVIGSSRYHGFDAAAREVEVGWTFLARSHWGGRYNGEVKRLMLGHAFASGAVDRVLFLIGPQNIRSQRAIERVGGVRAGTRRDDTGRESLVYAITAEAFAAGLGAS